MENTNQQKERRIRLWIEQYRSDLVRICAVYLSDVSMAEDIVQETFLKAWRAMDQFEGRNGCSEKTWLISIAINTCRSYCRTRWFRHVDSAKSLESIPFRSTDALPEERDLFIDIARLPEKYKSVILLYYDQGMTQREIAGVLGISRSIVAHRLKKAVDMLRISLGEEERL
ncbi:MAG: sigma-70 family RNA polymerase sigma factor [Clostridia bacterium]|nr:sigma-70 family RNA polymerase sigma factor [Clostridia bacterium]